MELIHDLNAKLFDILNITDNFVSIVTKDRDESHSIAHMRCVLHNTLKILIMSNIDIKSNIAKNAFVTASLYPF